MSQQQISRKVEGRRTQHCNNSERELPYAHRELQQKHQEKHMQDQEKHVHHVEQHEDRDLLREALQRRGSRHPIQQHKKALDLRHEGRDGGQRKESHWHVNRRQGCGHHNKKSDRLSELPIGRKEEEKAIKEREKRADNGKQKEEQRVQQKQQRHQKQQDLHLKEDRSTVRQREGKLPACALLTLRHAVFTSSEEFSSPTLPPGLLKQQSVEEECLQKQAEQQVVSVEEGHKEGLLQGDEQKRNRRAAKRRQQHSRKDGERYPAVGVEADENRHTAARVARAGNSKESSEIRWSSSSRNRRGIGTGSWQSSDSSNRSSSRIRRGSRSSRSRSQSKRRSSSSSGSSSISRICEKLKNRDANSSNGVLNSSSSRLLDTNRDLHDSSKSVEERIRSFRTKEEDKGVSAAGAVGGGAEEEDYSEERSSLRSSSLNLTNPAAFGLTVDTDRLYSKEREAFYRSHSASLSSWLLPFSLAQRRRASAKNTQQPEQKKLVFSGQVGELLYVPGSVTGVAAGSLAASTAASAEATSAACNLSTAAAAGSPISSPATQTSAVLLRGSTPDTPLASSHTSTPTSRTPAATCSPADGAGPRRAGAYLFSLCQTRRGLREHGEARRPSRLLRFSEDKNRQHREGEEHQHRLHQYQHKEEKQRQVLHEDQHRAPGKQQQAPQSEGKKQQQQPVEHPQREVEKQQLLRHASEEDLKDLEHQQPHQKGFEQALHGRAVPHRPPPLLQEPSGQQKKKRQEHVLHQQKEAHQQGDVSPQQQDEAVLKPFGDVLKVCVVQPHQQHAATTQLVLSYNRSPLTAALPQEGQQNGGLTQERVLRREPLNVQQQQPLPQQQLQQLMRDQRDLQRQQEELKRQLEELKQQLQHQQQKQELRRLQPEELQPQHQAVHPLSEDDQRHKQLPGEQSLSTQLPKPLSEEPQEQQLVVETQQARQHTEQQREVTDYCIRKQTERQEQLQQPPYQQQQGDHVHLQRHQRRVCDASQHRQASVKHQQQQRRSSQACNEQQTSLVATPPHHASAASHLLPLPADDPSVAVGSTGSSSHCHGNDKLYFFDAGSSSCTVGIDTVDARATSPVPVATSADVTSSASVASSSRAAAARTFAVPVTSPPTISIPASSAATGFAPLSATVVASVDAAAGKSSTPAFFTPTRDASAVVPAAVISPSAAVYPPPPVVSFLPDAAIYIPSAAAVCVPSGAAVKFTSAAASLSSTAGSVLSPLTVPPCPRNGSAAPLRFEADIFCRDPSCAADADIRGPVVYHGVLSTPSRASACSRACIALPASPAIPLCMPSTATERDVTALAAGGASLYPAQKHPRLDWSSPLTEALPPGACCLSGSGEQRLAPNLEDGSAAFCGPLFIPFNSDKAKHWTASATPETTPAASTTAASSPAVSPVIKEAVHPSEQHTPPTTTPLRLYVPGSWSCWSGASPCSTEITPSSYCYKGLYWPGFSRRDTRQEVSSNCRDFTADSCLDRNDAFSSCVLAASAATAARALYHDALRSESPRAGEFPLSTYGAARVLTSRGHFTSPSFSHAPQLGRVAPSDHRPLPLSSSSRKATPPSLCLPSLTNATITTPLPLSVDVSISAADVDCVSSPASTLPGSVSPDAYAEPISCDALVALSCLASAGTLPSATTALPSANVISSAALNSATAEEEAPHNSCLAIPGAAGTAGVTDQDSTSVLAGLSERPSEHLSRRAYCPSLSSSSLKRWCSGPPSLLLEKHVAGLVPADCASPPAPLCPSTDAVVSPAAAAPRSQQCGDHPSIATSLFFSAIDARVTSLVAIGVVAPPSPFGLFPNCRVPTAAETAPSWILSSAASTQSCPALVSSYSFSAARLPSPSAASLPSAAHAFNNITAYGTLRPTRPAGVTSEPVGGFTSYSACAPRSSALPRSSSTNLFRPVLSSSPTSAVAPGDYLRETTAAADGLLARTPAAHSPLPFKHIRREEATTGPAHDEVREEGDAATGPGLRAQANENSVPAASPAHIQAVNTIAAPSTATHLPTSSAPVGTIVRVISAHTKEEATTQTCQQHREITRAAASAVAANREKEKVEQDTATEQIAGKKGDAVIAGSTVTAITADEGLLALAAAVLAADRSIGVLLESRTGKETNNQQTTPAAEAADAQAHAAAAAGSAAAGSAAAAVPEPLADKAAAAIVSTELNEEKRHTTSMPVRRILAAADSNTATREPEKPVAETGTEAVEGRPAERTVLELPAGADKEEARTVAAPSTTAAPKKSEKRGSEDEDRKEEETASGTGIARVSAAAYPRLLQGTPAGVEKEPAARDEQAVGVARKMSSAAHQLSAANAAATEEEWDRMGGKGTESPFEGFAFSPSGDAAAEAAEGNSMRTHEQELHHLQQFGRRSATLFAAAGPPPELLREKLYQVLTKDNFKRSARASFQYVMEQDSAFDLDGDGYLRPEDLDRLMSRLCRNLQLPPVEGGVLRVVFDAFDTSKRGRLNLEEFCHMYWELLCRIRDKFFPMKKLLVHRSGFVGRQNLSGTSTSIEHLFTFVKKLGSGAFGDVHLVIEKRSNMQRVIKTINKDRSHVPRQQVEAEIEVLKSLDHPNIIKIFEVYEDYRNIYIVMEICEGGELLERVVTAQEQEEALSERYVAGLTQQIMSALAYFHSRHVVHKDLKPENILFKDRSPQSPIKIIDFGLAELFDTNEKSHNAAGTALYMAPEVFDRIVTFKCDVWSAGVVLYLLLTGCLPFTGSTLEEVQMKVKFSEPNYAEECKHLTRCVLHLLRWLLTKDPDRRPTAAEVLHHEWFQQAAVAALPLSPAICTNMRRYMRQSHLKNALVNLMAHQLNLTGQQIRQINIIFRQLDKNGDGILSHDELTEGLLAAGVPRWDINRILQSIDVDDSGNVSYTEFLAACYCWQETEINAVWIAFKKIDKDGDGKISLGEFCDLVLGRNSKLVPEHEMEALIAQMDKNGDGMIDWDEFVAYMRQN